jgi:MoaA/NifB/PqqE/SkfB family radical SAM enzyme
MTAVSYIDAARTYATHLRRYLSMERFAVVQEGVAYHCPLTLAKRHNLAAQQVNKRFLSRVELALPHILHVGVTTYCNLQCPGCPTGTRALGRPREHLSFDLFRRVVDELRGSLMFMLFWDWGEPLMHPRLADMIGHARRSGIRTVVSTNGTVANSPRQIERLVESRPDVIIVCVDGATQESYESYRRGGRLEDVLTTLRRLTETRHRLGLDRPVIEFRSLATRYSENELVSLLGLAEETGADFFSVKTLRPYDYRGHDIDNELVPLDPALMRYGYRDPQAISAEERLYAQGSLTCGKPMYAPTLNSDGELVFCSYAGFEEERFGSLVDTNTRRLWRSSTARRKREHFLTAQGTRSCARCYFRSDTRPTVLTTVPLGVLPDDIALVRPVAKDEFLRRTRGVPPHAPRARVQVRLDPAPA